jgi:uncharacterized membrane protein YczE
VNRPLPVRLAMVLAGFVVMGTGIVAMKQSDLGLGPWDVLHDGIGSRLDVDLGVVGIALGVPILLLWWPLRLRPNIGTVLNVVCIGLVIHYELPHTTAASVTWLRVALLAGGLVLFAVGQGLYLAPDLGAGPRDGLMTGLHHRFRISIRAARTSIEVGALVLGIVLGGTAGVGTLVFALAIGPMVQLALGWFGWTSSVAAEELADPLGLSGE